MSNNSNWSKLFTLACELECTTIAECAWDHRRLCRYICTNVCEQKIEGLRGALKQLRDKLWKNDMDFPHSIEITVNMIQALPKTT